jgi:peroxiredoxin
MRTIPVTAFCAVLAGIMATAAFAALESGKPSPALTIQQPSGPPIQVSQYKGKVVLLAFIDTNCPHCQALTGVLNNILKQYEPKGVQVVACAMNDHAKDLLPQFIQQYHPAFPVGYCVESAVFAYTQFSIAAQKPFYVPHLVFLDRRGIVRGDFPGEDPFMTKPDINIPTKLDELLKSGTVSNARKAPPKE